MQTLKNFSRKVVTGLVAVAAFAVMSGFSPVAANAQSAEDLQAQIAALLAQINQLQSQLGTQDGTTATGLSCDFTFTRDLSAGSTGADVMDLQEFLNSVPGITVAATGAGSAGNETSYFGPATAQAVSAFQVKYSAEVLAPLGLTSGTGYFGASSRAKARELCTTQPTPNVEVCGDGIDNDGDGLVDEDCPDGDDDDDDDDTGELEGGEGSVTDYQTLSEFNDEEVMEGQTEKVFGFQFEADGSDIAVRRVDVLFEANDDNSTSDDDAQAEPWDFVESLNLYHGDELVAEMEADSSGDWSKVATSDMDGESDDDTYRVRFSGLDEVVREDNESEWSLEVVARDVLDSGDIPQNFEIAVADSGIRAVDAAGINVYGGSDSASYQVQMTFDETTAGELELSDSEDFDDDVVAQVSATSDTDDVTVGMFELEADEQDVTVEDLTAAIVVNGGSDVDNVVSSLGLYVGDDLIESKTVTSSSAASTTVTFDDIDYVIDEDENVTFTLKADIQELDGTTDQTEGTVIYSYVRGTNVDAEDAEGDNVTVSEDWNVTGDYTVSLYSQLPSLSLTSTSAEKGAADNNGVIDDATYTFKFDVTAVGGDVWVPNDAIAATSSPITGSSDDSVEVLITGSASASTTGATDGLATLQSTSNTTTNSRFKVPSGTTRTFTATVRYDNDGGNEGFYHAEMSAFNWATSSSASLQSFTSGFSDWDTDSVFLDN